MFSVGKQFKMDIKQSGSQPSRIGPAENFTGSVRVDPLFDTPSPARVMGSTVTSEPRRANRLARPHVGTDSDCDGRLRSGATLGRPD